MTFFRQFFYAEADFSVKKYVSVSPKISNLHAKIAQNWQIALFNYFCVSEFFAIFYCRRKFEQINLTKKRAIGLIWENVARKI